VRFGLDAVEENFLPDIKPPVHGNPARIVVIIEGEEF
jgi:hypothetical protein